MPETPGGDSFSLHSVCAAQTGAQCLRFRRSAALLEPLAGAPASRRAIRDRFDCVLVDEFQDTNPIQAQILKRLCVDGEGLTVVGDDAQSIYSFRGATVRNILDFPKNFQAPQSLPWRRIIAAPNRSWQRPTRSSPRHLKASASNFIRPQDGRDQPMLVSCADEHGGGALHRR